jgi:uncharacterized protein YecE (DUF72 family)
VTKQLSFTALEEQIGVVDDPEAAALAARLPAWLRFGTSSWTYPGWAGLVWSGRPSETALARRGLAAYARHPLLRSVGVDRSWHQPLARAEWAEYARVLPSEFRIVAKAWSELTVRVFPDHPRAGTRAGQANPRFLDVGLARELESEYRAGLGAHAGPLVLELSPSVTSDVTAALEPVLAALDGPVAVEARCREVLTPRHVSLLHARGAAHVFNFWSAMPPVAAQLARVGLTAGFAVARLLQPPGTRYEQLREAYAPFDRLVAVQAGMRADAVALVKACAEAGVELFVLVGNKAEGSAPRTVRALAELAAAALGR